MRFDKIDLVGTFKIKGLTGNAGQAIGLSGSEFTWVDAQATTIEALGLTGTNYVICQSGTDSYVNGDLFLSAYATASDIATATMQRTSLLVTPGVYTINNWVDLTTPMVDIVGLSSNPSDVVLQSMGQYLFRITSAIDVGLSNMTFDLASNSFGIFDVNGGSYFRCNNLVFKNGSIFTDESESSQGIIGEFENIEIIDCANAFFVFSGDINGYFKNIKLKNCLKFFISDQDNIYGTFSNIEVTGSSLEYGFYAGTDNNAYYENIDILGDIQYEVFGGTRLLGIHRNINIRNCGGTPFYTGTSLFGNFENIFINYCGGAFIAGGSIDGNYNNIQIIDCQGGLFNSNSGSLGGNYRDIRVGNIYSYFVKSYTGYIRGDFRHISLNDVGISCFEASGGDIMSVVDDFVCNSVTASVFYSENNLIGTFSNIKINRVGENLFYSSNQNLYGTYLNIDADSTKNSFFATQSINAEFGNITIGSASGFTFLSNSGSLDGVYDNVKIGDVNENTFCSLYGTISGTFSDIEVGNIPNGFSFFYSSHEISGRYKNISMGNLQTAFGSVYADCIGYFENINFKNITNTIFSGVNIYGTFKNLKGGDCNGLFVASDTIDTESKNIEIKSCANFFNSQNANIVGTYSNISCLGTASSAFVASSYYLSGRFEDLYFPNSTSNFMSSSGFLLPFVMKRLHLKGCITIPFQGAIQNSYIDSRGLGVSSILLGHTQFPTIERCKFLSDSSVSTINSTATGSAARHFTSYTITNYGFAADLVTNNLIGPPNYNINNPNLI